MSSLDALGSVPDDRSRLLLSYLITKHRHRYYRLPNVCPFYVIIMTMVAKRGGSAMPCIRDFSEIAVINSAHQRPFNVFRKLPLSSSVPVVRSGWL
jgi:hypothetical protein